MYLAAALVAFTVLGATRADAIWISSSTTFPMVNPVTGASIGKVGYKPRNGALTKGYFKLKAKNTTCAVTDGIPDSADELICILHITAAIGAGFSQANVIAFTEVHPGNVVYFNHQDAALLVAAGVVSPTSGECYPWDGGFYLSRLASDNSITAAISSYDGQIIAMDKNPLSAVPLLAPCALF
jgi:hypothetical protein